MKKLFISILVIISLSGCISVKPIENTDNKNKTLEYSSFTGFTIGRFIDREAGVVCYTGIESISCLPISETKLK